MQETEKAGIATSRDEDVVIGIDSSTQSVKAIAWTRDGRPVAEGRAQFDILQPQPLHAEQDADSWWSGTAAALKMLTAQIDPARVAGIAIANQRETMALLDADGRPLAPATLWLDRRAREMPDILSAELSRSELHRISGKPVDVIPCVYRLRYLREHDPDLLDRTALIASVQDVLTLKLTGTATASWTSADPFGIFDIHEKQWSRTILDHLKIRPNQLPALVRPGTRIGAVTAQAAGQSGLTEGTPVYAAGGDGHCAGLGVGAIKPGTVYLNLGTAIVGGLWSETPELSRYWRTLVSPTGEGYILETVQRAGAFFVNWLIDNFAGGRKDPGVFDRLEEEAARLPVGSAGVAVCSYLVGCMDPHWDEDARATFTGLGPEHGIGHLYRASLEAITLEVARALDQMRNKGLPLDRIIVIGGGASSRLWVRMVADATGLPVIRGLSNEASTLGAGMTAAVGVGWHASFSDAVAAMTQIAERIEPDTAAKPDWDRLSVRQAAVYTGTAKAGSDTADNQALRDQQGW